MTPSDTSEPATETSSTEPAPTARVTLQWIPPAVAKNAESRGLFEQLLNSSVLVAALTTLIGGVLVQMLLAGYQAAEKEREREIATYSHQLVKQQEAVQRAYDLLGAQISSAEDLISITSSHFELAGLRGTALTQLSKQREEIMTRHNTLGRAWRAETLKVGMLLTYNHANPALVTPAWTAGLKGVEALQSCAEGHYRAYLNNPKITSDGGQVCREARSSVDAALVSLQSVLANGKP